MNEKHPIYVKFLTVSLLFFISCVNGCATSDIISTPKIINKFPREAFTQVRQEVELEGCGLNKETGMSECQGAIMKYVSSGAYIFRSEISESIYYVLTAGHSCKNNIPSVRRVGDIIIKKKKSTFTVVGLNGIPHRGEVVKTNDRFDLCLMKVHDIYKAPPVLKISKLPPEPGDMVKNMAAPHGLFWRDTVLLFQGVFSGYHDRGYSVYTIPTKPGSSGSPIINSKNELIGVIFAGYPKIENVGLSSPLVAIKVFLKNSIAMAEIKMWQKNNVPDAGKKIVESWSEKMAFKIGNLLGI